MATVLIRIDPEADLGREIADLREKGIPWKLIEEAVAKVYGRHFCRQWLAQILKGSVNRSLQN